MRTVFSHNVMFTAARFFHRTSTTLSSSSSSHYYYYSRHYRSLYNSQSATAAAFTTSLRQNPQQYPTTSSRTPPSSSSSRLFATLPTETYTTTTETTKTTTTTPTIFKPSGISDTPLGHPPTSQLLHGLKIHTILAKDDGHPLTVYEIDDASYDKHSKKKQSSKSSSSSSRRRRRIPILLLHGRTWSSIPVYHLAGGPRTAEQQHHSTESRSLLESLRFYDENENDVDIVPYAMDFRGFGGTPPTDERRRVVVPKRCVSDALSVMEWIIRREEQQAAAQYDDDDEDDDDEIVKKKCALLGWSQGALVAQLLAQSHPSILSRLILYGSIYNPTVVYPRSPLFYAAADDVNDDEPIKNTFDGAIEDFTVEGSIASEPARLFADKALECDPMKAKWVNLHEFNECDPGRVNVPTLVVAGDEDPYAPIGAQAQLFKNLGKGCDRTWSVIAGCDHAVHMLDERGRFVKVLMDFIKS